MKIISVTKIGLLCLALLAFVACKKSYITGAPEDVNKYAHTSTYDVLKGNPNYDTLMQLIDTAGLKDKINAQGVTFFAPSNNSIFNYLQQRTIAAQLANQYAEFALDSLFYYLRNNVNGTRDSLLMYLIPQPLTYNVLTNYGTTYATELPGDSVIVSYEYVTDPNLGYNALVSGQPQLVYFTQLWYPFTPTVNNPVGSIASSIGIHDLVISSGIITQNGIIEGLDNSNPLFFYGTKQ
jgi:hypothetical protein